MVQLQVISDTVIEEGSGDSTPCSMLRFAGRQDAHNTPSVLLGRARSHDPWLPCMDQVTTAGSPT